MSERTVSDRGDTSTGKYPQHAGITLAAQDGSERYYFRSPTGGIASIPAMDADQARKLLADDVRGFAPEDFEQVDDFDAEPWEYPDPVDSDRDVNEYDIWSLRRAFTSAWSKFNPRRNPTEYTLEAILDHWDDPADIPLHDRDALQDAPGIGPQRAGTVVGAAVAKRLTERPIRASADTPADTGGGRDA